MALATIPQKLLSVQACLRPNFDRYWPKWPWRSRSNVTICNPIRELSKMHLTAKFSDPSYNSSKGIVSTSPFSANFDRFRPKWPWRSRSNVTICNPVWEPFKMHLTAEFGSPSYNHSKVIESTSPFSDNFDRFGPNDLEDQGQMTAYAIPSENYPRRI